LEPDCHYPKNTDGCWDGVGNRGAVTVGWILALLINSCVRRWLWRSVYEIGSTLVDELVTRSLNSLCNPRNTCRTSENPRGIG